MKNKFLLSALAVCFVIMAESGTASAAAFWLTAQNNEDRQCVDISPKQINNQMNTMAYPICTANYTVKDEKSDLAISYPQVVISADDAKWSRINDLIKAEAFYFADLFSTDTARHFSMRIQYKITCLRRDLLSVQYTGSAYMQDAPYPTNLFYTTNIDLSTGNKIRLQDVVTIDEAFAAKLRDERLKPLRLGEILNGKQVFVRKLGRGSSEPADTIHLLADADLARGIYCYFTSDSLGISVPVIHALGDHAEFEIAYREIMDNIKAEKRSWITALEGY